MEIRILDPSKLSPLHQLAFLLRAAGRVVPGGRRAWRAAEEDACAPRVCSPQIIVSERPRGPLIHPGGGCAPFLRAEPTPRLGSKQPRRGTGAQSGPCGGGAPHALGPWTMHSQPNPTARTWPTSGLVLSTPHPLPHRVILSQS